nr:Pm69 [Triticum dicoccoides]
MEAALVSVATGVLKPVLEKLAALLGDEYKRFKGVRKDIKSIARELAAMEAFLLKMSEEEDPDVQDKFWMNEVRELSYDMEDAIDDFMQSVGDKDEKPDDFIEKIKNTLEKLGKMKARRRIGKEIQDLKKQIIQVGDRNARYKGRQTFSSTKNEIVDPRILARFEHASKLVGIDETKAEIIKLLGEENGQVPRQQQLKILSIVGFGGMGKTTLANQVYQDLKGEFQYRAFISVSQNPDLMKILRTILSEITGISYPGTEAGCIEQLIDKIKDFLADKRYLIVIDDIWDIKHWEVIRCALANNHYENRVITTTRDRDVARKVGGAYELKPLPDETSKILFFGRIFGINNDCPDDLVEVSETIMKKCGGVPLAIITIAGLLASRERNKREWNKLCDSIGSGLDNSPDVKTMRNILALSYRHLPIHLKTCLLYLSIFPEDYIIQGDRLIWRWICEGFLNGVQDEDLFELGESYITELINRGLIQAVDSYRYVRTTDCRVHDLVLEFISSISIEENFCTVLHDKKAKSAAITSKVRRLFLQLQHVEMPQGRLILSHMRSLTVSGNWVDEMSPLSFSHQLRVLDLEGCYLAQRHDLLAHLGSLCQLRYLSLGNAYLGDLLLAIQIGQLKSLICLRVGGRFKIKFRPGVVRELECLQELSMINLSKSPHVAKELRHLTKLRVLGISFEDMPDESLKGWLLESLGHLRNLQSLIVSTFGCVSLDFFWEGWTSPPRNLRRFHSSFSYLSLWISPSNLRELSIIEIKLDNLRREDLDILGSFPSLQSLRLRGYKNIWDEERKQWPVISADTFQCLRECVLGILPMGGNMFAPGAMPKVQSLTFDCYIEDVFSLGLANLPSLRDSLGLENLPSLQELHVCLEEFTHGSITREAYDKAKAAIRCAADNHPNRPTLKVGMWFCPSWASNSDSA